MNEIVVTNIELEVGTTYKTRNNRYTVKVNCFAHDKFYGVYNSGSKVADYHMTEDTWWPDGKWADDPATMSGLDLIKIVGVL